MDIYEVIKRLNTGYMMSDTSGKIEMCFAATGLLTKVHIFLGQPKVAEEILSSFHDKAVKEGAPQLLPNLETMQMWLQLLQGKVNVGETWLEHAPNENMGFCTLDRYRYIQKVRCLIASNRYVEALCLIERLDVYFVDYERHYMWMQNQLLKAMIQYRMGNEAWEETLDKALVKMERHHFVRLAGYEGIALKTLLDKMEHPSVSEKFLRKCKKEVDRMAGYYSNYLGIEKQLMEPLTDKESQILQMMCEHQTSEQICERCDFTYSTLKFHNRNIYRKLGVKNRKEAEAAAAQLRLSEK